MLNFNFHQNIHLYSSPDSAYSNENNLPQNHMKFSHQSPPIQHASNMKIERNRQPDLSPSQNESLPSRVNDVSPSLYNARLPSYFSPTYNDTPIVSQHHSSHLQSTTKNSQNHASKQLPKHDRTPLTSTPPNKQRSPSAPAQHKQISNQSSVEKSLPKETPVNKNQQNKSPQHRHSGIPQRVNQKSSLNSHPSKASKRLNYPTSWSDKAIESFTSVKEQDVISALEAELDQTGNMQDSIQK